MDVYQIVSFNRGIISDKIQFKSNCHLAELCEKAEQVARSLGLTITQVETQFEIIQLWDDLPFVTYADLDEG